MLFWTSDKVPDTRVPKHLNENAEINQDPAGLKSIVHSTLRRQFYSSYIPPHRQEQILAWRPPRETDSHYHDLHHNHMDDIIRESWIKTMMLRLVRDQLNACYKDNGVNHYENCAHLSELYLKWMRDGYRVRGANFRSKVDTRKMMRDPRLSAVPKDAPFNRIWHGIDGKGHKRLEDEEED